MRRATGLERLADSVSIRVTHRQRRYLEEFGHLHRISVGESIRLLLDAEMARDGAGEGTREK
jgi:hypothetical protein